MFGLKVKKRFWKGVKAFAFISSNLYFVPSLAQQLPYYTQFRPNNVMLNPGVVGTKRILDARVIHRTQWVGFTDSPKTTGFAVNARLFGGSMGLGLSYFSDVTGPTNRNNLSLAYSYHALFDDVELSVGIAGHALTYGVDGNLLHMQIPFDNTINLTSFQKKKVYDGSVGAFFYNDRFHLGLSVLSLLEPSVNYYPVDDTVHKTNIHIVPHLYGSVGYNWSGQPDWLWENSLQVTYAEANPMVIDYNLRLHYKQYVFGGMSIRFGDAIALHVGATIKEEFHINYSYDIITSSLSVFQSGSHEILLAWGSNIGKDKKKKYDIGRFKRQKYGFMF